MITNVQDFTLKAQLAARRNPARIVKPRKDAKADMRIVVCDSTMKAWYEDKLDMGTDWDLIELVKYLRDNWPCDREGSKRTTPIMLVCHNPHKIFQKIHNVFKNDPEWNARFSVNTAERFHMDGTIRESKTKTMQDIRISLFGFRTEDRKTKYFHPITPSDFMDDFSKYGDNSWPEYIKLYHWGGSVRKWMHRHKLRFTPTRGGLSAQLLRDKRFYPQPRRKVPKQTNEKARTAMPGNFYAMIDVKRSVGTIYPFVYMIDQQNAHHYAAETVTLPDANTLFARGRFASLTDSPYVREGRHNFDKLLSEYGLLRARLWVPTGLGGMIPPWAFQHGLVDTFIYTNELQLCRELGIEIRHVSYAWTSPEVDVGLQTFAQWAQCEVTRYPEHRTWLKPTLLSAYGILGIKPRHMEMAYWRSESGEPYRYLLGPTPITMQRFRTRKQLQPPIANTIHRGMIEAETRKLSIELARELEHDGHNIIGIHADAVLVQDEGQQLPLLSPPWRVKDRLSRFKALDVVSYESDSVKILPGRKRGKR